MTDHSDTAALHRKYAAADEAWSLELRRAFGKAACDRRYDMDRRAHPASCNAAHAVFAAARDAWFAAMTARAKIKA